MKQKIERLRSLMENVASIRADIAEFDGDRRGMYACLTDAEEDFAEEVNKSLPTLLSHIDALEARVVEQVEQHNKLHELAEEYLARAEAAERALEEAVEVLGDISNPIRALQREASAEGRKLSGAAYAIANDLHFVQGLARAFITKRGEK